VGRKIAVVALALIVCGISAPTGSAAGGYRKVTRRLGRGVRYTAITDPAGPYRIKVLSISLPRRSTLEVALSNNALPGLERTSAMARRQGALAAVNGDYARSDGRPVYALAGDGWLAQSTPAWGRNFALNVRETAAYVGHGSLAITAREQDSGAVHEIHRFNEGEPRAGQIAAFTPAGAAAEKPPRRACSARLLPLQRPHATAAGPTEVAVVVDKVVCRYEAMSRRGGLVLATPRSGRRADEIASLAEGERLTLSWTMGWRGVLDAIGGNPTLVEGGEIVVTNGPSVFYDRHPRTGVGYTADGRVLLVVVDGRRPGFSVGMRLRRFARLMKNLGARYALNLDGGGSSTMWVRGRGVVNRPSDGRERPVSSALLVLPGADRRVQLRPRLAGDATTPTADDALEAAARDAASTGGLAAALRAEGRRLPAFLEAAATSFATR
jgi:exopolysaccharide biosynthesis protein